ncbi:MAG: Maf family protein [Bacillota bacterium]|uniref:Maf family protein n=1 Tax=Desulfurispora thermophila TaxID=265470 RepID=UPI00036A9F85|nr:Maf family protein [Desulfurispora thermophila]
MLYLASASPRRRELLSQLGAEFIVKTAQVSEDFSAHWPPARVVETLALRKAGAVARQLTTGLVIGADTVVVLEGRILGKPVDNQDALRMLSMLDGKTHSVFTGLAVVDAASGKSVVAHEETRVFFCAPDKRQLAEYAASEEVLDKAGAYAVQGRGARFVQRIEGCYFNVVGLPLALLNKILWQEFSYTL